MAIERGKLQNLLFDNQVMFSHRAMAAVLGVILKLPPIKQALAVSNSNQDILLHCSEGKIMFEDCYTSTILNGLYEMALSKTSWFSFFLTHFTAMAVKGKMRIS